MPKVLALSGLVISTIILILMLVDLVVTGGAASLMMNISFILFSLATGTLSFLTWKQQKK